MRLIDVGPMREEVLHNWQNEPVYDANAVLDLIDQQDTVEQPRWIPVAERMPPDDTDVLLCRGEERIVGRWFTEDKKDGPYWISNADFDEWHMNASELPTHWMPLPAPPTPEECSAVGEED